MKTFIILCYFVSTINSLTRFHFEATLGCSSKSRNSIYQYSVEHFEHDTFSAHDKITEEKEGIVEGDIIVLTTGEQFDDGLGNINYEVFATIKHNCTSDGIGRTLKIDLGKVKVTLAEVTIKYKAVLYNNGTKN